MDILYILTASKDMVGTPYRLLQGFTPGEPQIEGTDKHISWFCVRKTPTTDWSDCEELLAAVTQDPIKDMAIAINKNKWRVHSPKRVGDPSNEEWGWQITVSRKECS